VLGIDVCERAYISSLAKTQSILVLHEPVPARHFAFSDVWLLPIGKSVGHMVNKLFALIENSCSKVALTEALPPAVRSGHHPIGCGI